MAKQSKQLLPFSGHWTNLVCHNTQTPLTSATDTLWPNLSPSVLFIPWPDLKLVPIRPSLIVTLQCEGCFLHCSPFWGSAVSDSFILCFGWCNRKPQSINGVPYYYKYLVCSGIQCLLSVPWFSVGAFTHSMEFMSRWKFTNLGVLH